MAIKRISELDKVDQTNIENPFVSGSSPFKKFIFETSEFQVETPLANSYYISKFMDWGQLSTLLLKDVWAELNRISNELSSIRNGNERGNLALSIIEDWSQNGLPGNRGYPISTISCTNLSVSNPINGCAMSAWWA